MSVQIDERDRDMLGEASHVGAGRVAMALERMMGEGSQLTPPRVGDGVRPIGAIEISHELVDRARPSARILRDEYRSLDFSLRGGQGSDTTALVLKLFALRFRILARHPILGDLSGPGGVTIGNGHRHRSRGCCSPARNPESMVRWISIGSRPILIATRSS